MYKLPNVYQSRLEQEHLTGKGFNMRVNLPEGSAMIQTNVTMYYTGYAKKLSQVEQYQTEQVKNAQPWGKILLSPHPR
jgi:hypothetical protein